MEMKHINWKYFEITEEMFAMFDGDKYRKNRGFFKLLWKTLSNNIDACESIDDIFRENASTPYTPSSMESMSYIIRRAGWRWLEGVNGDVFGDRFKQEYVRRWDIMDKDARETDHRREKKVQQ